MFLIYNNDANPYLKDDESTIEWFGNVTEKCEKKKDQESSIENAFGYEDSESDGKVYHTELIARVPDIILTYKHNSTHLENVKKIFFELFDFYEQKIVPDMRKTIPDMEITETVREFNQWFDVTQDIDKYAVNVCKIGDEGKI
jgi:Ca2+-binding EF-hand superfamily protein